MVKVSGKILLIFFIYFTLCNGQEETKPEVEVEDIEPAKPDPKACGQYMMSKSSPDCCRMPTVTPKHVFKSCWLEHGFADPKQNKATQKSKISGSKKEKMMIIRGRRQAQELRTKKEKRALRKKQRQSAMLTINRGPGCLMECIMKNQSMIDSNNLIIKENVKKVFFRAVMKSPFRTFVPKAIETCYELYQNADQNATSATNCNHSKSQFMTCMRKEMELNCPRELQVNANTPKCRSRKEGLRICDPFYIQAELQEKMSKVAMSLKLEAEKNMKKSKKI